jgi:hypothetical protein
LTYELRESKKELVGTFLLTVIVLWAVGLKYPTVTSLIASVTIGWVLADLFLEKFVFKPTSARIMKRLFRITFVAHRSSIAYLSYFVGILGGYTFGEIYGKVILGLVLLASSVVAQSHQEANYYAMGLSSFLAAASVWFDLTLRYSHPAKRKPKAAEQVPPT